MCATSEEASTGPKSTPNLLLQDAQHSPLCGAKFVLSVWLSSHWTHARKSFDVACNAV